MLKLSKVKLHLIICLLLILAVGSTVTYAETPTEHKLASVNFFKADLVAVLQQLASECGYNVIITPDVKGTVTLQFSQTTFEEVLNYIIQANGLVYYREKNNFYIAKSGQLPLDKKNTGYFHLYYSEPKTVAESLQKIVHDAEIITDERTRTVIVSGSKEAVDYAAEIIKNMDQKLGQITIEVKVVEVSVSALHQLGAQFESTDGSYGDNLGLSDSGSTIILKMITQGHSWNAIFNALAENGKARLVTSPSVSTVEGKEASILIGDKIPIGTIEKDSNGNETTTVTYTDVGVNLIFTPWLQTGDEVSIDLKSQVNSLGNKETIGTYQYYIISTREVKSRIQTKIGETVFLGGLITQDERESLEKIPLLGDVPLLGKLFQNKETSKDEKELIISITPRWNQSIKLDGEK